MLKAALEQVFSAKTLTLWIILAVIAFVAFLVLVGVSIAFHQSFEGLYQSLLAFLGVGGAGGTTRNVISDGVMPRVPMTVAARTDPSIAVQSPTPMTAKPATSTNYAAPPSAPTNVGGNAP